MKRSCKEDPGVLAWSMRRCAMDNFRKIGIIDVEMAKGEIDRFEKGLEQRVGRMERIGPNDLVPLIRDKGYKLSALMKDVYEWHRCDYEKKLRKYDIGDKDVSRTRTDEQTLMWREISSIVYLRNVDLFDLIDSSQEIIDDCDVDLVEKLDELADRVEKVRHKTEYSPRRLAISETVFYCLATDFTDDDWH